jgi:predicted ATP-grasp superfamily ATP-dependent carboligase
MFQKGFNIYNQLEKISFLTQETLLYNLKTRAKTKILFSIAPVQEANLRKGLRFANIELDFNEFTDERICSNDFVIPLTIPDLKRLDEARHLVKNNNIPIPTLESINICDDKYVFYETLIKKGFGDLLPKIESNLPYTYILKKKITERGVDNYIISDAEAELKYQNFISSHDYFCQQMVLGNKEYATHILFRNKKIDASLNIEYIFSNDIPIKGQDIVMNRRIVASPFNQIFSEILESIEFEGICCINYKEVDGKPLIIEINPRFGASLSLYFISFLRKI